MIISLAENGTTNEWVAGREVFTTSEWESLANTPISFKIRAESNEGIWINNGIDSCVGCKFMYHVIDQSDPTTRLYTTWNMAGYDSVNDEQIPETPSVITTGLYDDYEELVGVINKNYFLGVKLNSNNQVTNAYSCGIKDNVPFCIEGTLPQELGGTQYDTIYASNKNLLQGPNIYNNTCTVTQESWYEKTDCGFLSSIDEDIFSYTDSTGHNTIGEGYSDRCYVDHDGYFGCNES